MPAGSERELADVDSPALGGPTRRAPEPSDVGSGISQADADRRFPRDFRDIEDAFGLAGLAGLPEPTQLLREYLEAYQNLTEVERTVSEEQLAELARNLNASESAIAGLSRDREALSKELESLREAEKPIAVRERELVAVRAELGSTLAARRSTYPDRFPVEWMKARQTAVQLFLEGLREQQNAISSLERDALEGSQTLRGDLARRDDSVRQRFEAVNKDLQRLQSVLRTCERLGLTKSMAGAMFWLSAVALICAGGVFGVSVGRLLAEPFAELAQPLAVLASAIVGIPATAGPIRGGIALASGALLVVVLCLSVIAASDALFAKLFGTWWETSAKKHSRRDQLPGLWSGGEGRRLFRADLAARAIRMPLTLTSCFPIVAAAVVISTAPAGRALVGSAEFWASAIAAAAGITVAGVIGALIALWLESSAAFDDDERDQSPQVLGLIRRLTRLPLSAGVALCLLGAPAPYAFTSPVVPWLFPELGFMCFAATTFAVGLAIKGQWRAKDVLAAEQQRLDALFGEIVLRNCFPDVGNVRARIAEVARQFEELWTGGVQGGETGIIAYMRPTRRFFNTPQQSDALDKATIDEYSAADALLEPELLSKAFANAAAMEQVRTELEALRTRRRAIDERAGSVDIRLAEAAASRERLIESRAACLRRAALRATNDAKRRLVCQLQAAAAYRQGSEIHERSVNVAEQ